MLLANSLITVVTILLSMAPTPLALTSPLLLSPSTKFSYTGTQVFASYFGTGTSSVNPLIYVLTFPTAQVDTLYKSGICVQQIHYQITGNHFNLTFFTSSRTMPALQIKVYSNVINKIQTMTMRYMTVVSSWCSFAFYYFWQPVFTSIISGSSYTFSTGGLDPVVMTQTVRVFTILNGFDITASDTFNFMGLKLMITRTSSTGIQGVLSTSSTKSINVKYITFQVLTYTDEQVVGDPIVGKYVLGSFTSTTNAGLIYNDVTNIVRDYNTMFGLYQFYISNQNFLDWNATVTPSTSISVASANSFHVFSFNYLIMQYTYCGDLTPFLMVVNSTCYDVCPERYYDDSTVFECQPCLYDCYYCNTTGNGKCTVCNDTIDFRVFNNVTKRCVALPGYYDDGLSHNVALPCNNASCLTCSSLTHCLSCYPAQYLASNFTCINCMTNCLNCTSAATCTLCLAPYVFVITCVPNCSLITSCSTCQVSGNITQCLTCLIGFSLDNTTNTCNQICGDGIRSGLQGCDDANNISGDGCSSVCAIQSAYFCVGSIGNLSTCQACSIHCLNCTSLTTCTQCETLYTFNTTATVCVADCSLITSCLTCTVNVGVLQCTNCITGFEVNSNFTCSPICGDGLVLGGQLCDDNNTANNDGCSLICVIEAAHYCVGTPSVCNNCSQYCLNCTSATTCSNCLTNTTWIVGNTTCSPTCILITYCNSCTINSVSLQIQCFACSGGYSVNSSNQCSPICGDGKLAPEQFCDDNNLVDGDGCSSSCLVETNYVCNGTTPGNYSQCYLTNMIVSLVNIIKVTDQNSAIFTFKPEPANLPIYQTMNWSNLITIKNGDATITNAYYDPSTGQVIVDVDYHSTIDGSNLNVNFNPSNQSTLFIYVPPVDVKFNAVSDNNQALYYYSSDDYMITKIGKFLSYGIGIMALFFLFAGFFGGRLIGLQTAGVIQLTYLSLLTLDNMSPSFNQLQNLKISCGYNKLQNYKIDKSIDRPFNAGQFNIQYVQNYNIMVIVILLPLLCFVIFKIYAKLAKRQTDQKMIKICKYALGQFILYGFLCFSYLIYLSFFIEIVFDKSPASSILDLVVGVSLFLLGLVYFLVYFKADTYFQQFKFKFKKNQFCQHFYTFWMIQRFVCPAIFVFMINFAYQNLLVLAIYLFILTVICNKEPYHGNKKCWRPMTNCIIVILIQIIFFVAQFLNDPKGMIALYGPLGILGLLVFCVAYSLYAIFQDLSQSLKNAKQLFKSGSEQLSLQQNQMKQFTKKFLKKDNTSIFCQKPTSLTTIPISDIKDKLSKIKMELGSKKIQSVNISSDRKCSQEMINQNIDLDIDLEYAL